MVVTALRLLLLMQLVKLSSSNTVFEDQSKNNSLSVDDSLKFPDGFLFGTAIAGFQVDMGCPTIDADECEDRNADWYTYITNRYLKWIPYLYLSGDSPSLGPGFYELYEQDLDLAANELDNNSFRFSIEWSRIFPNPTDNIDDDYDTLKDVASPTSLAYYHQLLAALRARNLKPFVTLNHYSLPTWIHDTISCHFFFLFCKNRGWADHGRIVREITKYAGFVAREFGDEIDLWSTLNEPMFGVVIAGYVRPGADRSNPPGRLGRIWQAQSVTAAMIEAHARMYDAIHANDLVDADADGISARVGIVYNIQPVIPKSDNELDSNAADNLSYFFNFLFLDAVTKGMFDKNWNRQQMYRSDLADRMDFLGINYYYRITSGAIPIVSRILNFLFGLFGTNVPALLSFNPLDLPLDTSYNRGLYEVIHAAWDRYKLPIIVSEVGSSSDNDDVRVKKLVDTLVYTNRAISDGIPIEGYHWWSLIDNYEWNKGMSSRYGLYTVNINSQDKTRSPHPAAFTYKEVAGSGRISSDLNSTVPE